MADVDTVVTVKPTLKRPSMWTCLFMNDDYTPMVFVTQVLVEIYNQTRSDAEVITQRIHVEGKSPVGSYPKDIAMLKADQTFAVAIAYQYPLQVIPTEL